MDLLNKHKRVFLLTGMAICVAAMIVTLNPNYRPTVIAQTLWRFVVRLQGAMTTFSSWAESQITLFTEMRYLQEQNAVLLEHNGWLEIENQRLRMANEEIQGLLDLLYIREQYGELSTIGARIIGYAPGGWSYSFIIDRGSNDGLLQNMAVLGHGGLVGVIHWVYPTHSSVIAIIDDRFRAAVQSVRTMDEGIIEGDSTLMLQNLVRMNYISYRANIMIGDEVVTSTMSMFPPGIRVGIVIDVHPTPDGLAQTAIVSPAANVSILEHVLVINELYGPQHMINEYGMME